MAHVQLAVPHIQLKYGNTLADTVPQRSCYSPLLDVVALRQTTLRSGQLLAQAANLALQKKIKK